MRTSPKTIDIRYSPAPAGDRAHGLLGWASGTIDGALPAVSKTEAPSGDSSPPPSSGASRSLFPRSSYVMRAPATVFGEAAS